MRPRTILGLALGLLVAGCMTAEEQRAADEARCRDYGFSKRNDAFAECLQRLDLDRRAALRNASRIDPWDDPPWVHRRWRPPPWYRD